MAKREKLFAEWKTMLLTADCPTRPNRYFARRSARARREAHAEPLWFRLTYRSRDPKADRLYAALGRIRRRSEYQIAVEREEGGCVRWHCTCADWVYRNEDFPDYQCKHIRAESERAKR